MEPDIMRSEAMATRYGTERGGNWEARGKGRRAVFRTCLASFSLSLSLSFFCSGLWKKWLHSFLLCRFPISSSRRSSKTSFPPSAVRPPPALFLPFQGVQT